MKSLFKRSALTLGLVAQTAALCASSQINDTSIDEHQFNFIWFQHQPTDYSVIVNDREYPGTMAWGAKLKMMESVIDFRGLKVADLNATSSLPLTFLAKNCGTVQGMALVSTRENVIFANQLQHALGVSYPVHNTDYDRNRYESHLGYHYDVILCLNILGSVKDKHRMMNYLSRFRKVFFEDEHLESEAIELFDEYGFEHYKVVGEKEYNGGKTLFYFYR